MINIRKSFSKVNETLSAYFEILPTILVTYEILGEILYENDQEAVGSHADLHTDTAIFNGSKCPG